MDTISFVTMHIYVAIETKRIPGGMAMGGMPMVTPDMLRKKKTPPRNEEPPEEKEVTSHVE